MRRTLFALLAITLLSLGTPLLAQTTYPQPATETPSSSPDVDVDASLNPPDVDVDVDADTDADTEATGAEDEALPATASQVPLAGLLGLMALGAGLGLRVASRRS